MKYVLNSLAALLFPPSPERRRVAALTEKNLLMRMCPRRTPHTITLFSYADPDIRALILRAKYHHDSHAIELLGRALASYLGESECVDRILIPVPLSRERFRERGYNQVAEVMCAARLEVSEKVIKRTKNTAPQTDLPREKRLINVSGAFTCSAPELVRGKHVVLIDDVTTTGATLKAARTTLLNAGAKRVACIALAG